MSFIVHVLATATTLAAGYLLKAPRIEVDFWHGAADELLRGGSGEVRVPENWAPGRKLRVGYRPQAAAPPPF